MSVAFLNMAGKMVFTAESLSAILAQKVLASRMHHQVASHVLTGVKAPFAVFALMSLLFSRGSAFPSMPAQVLQQQGSARVRLQTHLAGEVSTVSSVKGLVPSKAKFGVVALAAFRAAESLLVGVVCVEVVLQVIFTVEHLLAVAALVGLFWRVCGHVPMDTNMH